MNRLNNLEQAVFNRPSQASPRFGIEKTIARVGQGFSPSDFTPFGLHILSPSPDDASLDLRYLASQLPPVGQARELFNHFALTLHQTFGVLHIPSARDLVEQAYESMLARGEPDVAQLLLLFSIFAGSAFAWNAQLLEKLSTTQAEAQAAFKAYTHLATSILDSYHSLPSSTTALAAISTLAHVITNCDGFPLKIHLIRMRCLLMARAMQIHRLDTAKSREERKHKGCNLIEIEVQRRVWWNMVAFDWLHAFSGGPQEGAYIHQPKHMNVDYPSNVDDEFITPTEVHSLPLSTPTTMSAFIERVKLSEICREVVDAMPSILLESQPEYHVILALDEKFQNYLDDLPVFLRLDRNSIRKSYAICSERPNIIWQRIGINFSVHTRICRLHMPYHLEGMTNQKYAYSHRICVQSAQTVLELRRLMDDAETAVKPTRSWTVTQHSFLAALILATDVSFNPNSPDAEARKAKVLAAYRTLEKSKEESSGLVEVIQRNMQTLMSTLHRQHSQRTNVSYAASEETVANGQSSGNSRDPITSMASIPVSADEWLQGYSLMSTEKVGDENVAQLWSDFLAAAPELGAPQWNSLLDNMDFCFDPSVS